MAALYTVKVSSSCPTAEPLTQCALYIITLGQFFQFLYANGNLSWTEGFIAPTLQAVGLRLPMKGVLLTDESTKNAFLKFDTYLSIRFLTCSGNLIWISYHWEFSSCLHEFIGISYISSSVKWNFLSFQVYKCIIRIFHPSWCINWKILPVCLS